MWAPTLLILLASAGINEARSVLETRHADIHMHGLMHARSLHEPSRVNARIVDSRQNKNKNSGNAAQNGNAAQKGNAADATTLLANALQTGSFSDGSVDGAQKAGQSASKTSKNNFINLCSGKTLTNGLQVQAGSCNGIAMGDIPAKANMVSSIIVFPQVADKSIVADTTFNITVQTSNLEAGSFTNAAITYYAAPQALKNGNVVGHVHVTVQDLGASLNPKKALDATQFVFFKGINDAGNGQGLLSATVTGGLAVGNYRVCTMNSASNHQPVLMPVAQRGTPDDCTKFSVVAAKGGKGNGGNAGGATGGNGGNGNGGKGGKGDASSSAAASSSVKSVKSEQASKTKAQAVSSSAAASSSAKFVKSEKGSKTKAQVASSSAASDKASKTKAQVVASAAPFQNTTIAQTTTKAAGQGGKGNGQGGNGQGGKGQGGKGNGRGGNGNGGNANNGGSKATSFPVSAAASSISSSLKAVTTTKAVINDNGGKAVATAKSSQAIIGNNGGKAIATAKTGGDKTQYVIVHKVVIIKTFFKFVFSLGGLPPAVSKTGNSFAVLEEIFEDFSSACNAACGHQFTQCISFSGPGFSFEECTSQKESCGSVASTIVAPAGPETVKATVTVPPTASVTGSVLSEETITKTVQAQPTQAAAPPAGNEAAVTNTAQGTLPLASSSSTCAIVTSTVFIDPPTATATPIAQVGAFTSKPFSNATITSTAANSAVSSAPVSLSTGSSAVAALGGIIAPAITKSGNADRPFEVKGNTFVNEAAAVQRSCDVQFNACANAINAGMLKGAGLADCKKQQDGCVAAGA